MHIAIYISACETDQEADVVKIHEMSIAILHLARIAIHIRYLSYAYIYA